MKLHINIIKKKKKKEHLFYQYTTSTKQHDEANDTKQKWAPILDQIDKNWAPYDTMRSRLMPRD